MLTVEPTLVDTTPGAGGGDEGPGPLSARGIRHLAIDADEVTIPAGETRSVTMTADPAAVPAGAQYSGMLTASVDGSP